MIRNEKIVFWKKSDSVYNYLFYKLKLRNKNNYVDSEYLCKINPLDQHAYLNPYLLPCKNSACFDCIYNNFNLVSENIKCIFDSCKQVHRLQNSLEHDYKTSELIDQKSKELLRNMITFGNKMIDSRGIYRITILRNY